MLSKMEHLRQQGLDPSSLLGRGSILERVSARHLRMLRLRQPAVAGPRSATSYTSRVWAVLRAIGLVDCHVRDLYVRWGRGLRPEGVRVVLMPGSGRQRGRLGVAAAGVVERGGEARAVGVVHHVFL